MIKKRIFKCHFLLTNDLKNEKNSNVLISCIFLFPSSKQKGLLRRASIMFEIDQSGATINPLRKDKAPVLPVEEPNEGKETKPYNKWVHALRAVFFVLVPQFVWMLEYAYVENHFLMLAYVQIVYVVVLQSVLVETFVEHDRQKGKVKLTLCLMGLLYIGTCIVLRSPQAVTETMEGAGNCECGECEPYSTEDISKDAYPSFFSSGDTVMGIRMEVNGTRLSRGSTLEGIGVFIVLAYAVCVHCACLCRVCSFVLAYVVCVHCACLCRVCSFALAYVKWVHCACYYYDCRFVCPYFCYWPV